MERLVVGIDGTDSARAALRWALALADALRPSERPVTVDVVRVLAAPPDERRREAEEELAGLVTKVDGGRHVSARVVDGDPAAVLADLARDADAAAT